MENKLEINNGIRKIICSMWFDSRRKPVPILLSDKQEPKKENDHPTSQARDSRRCLPSTSDKITLQTLYYELCFILESLLYP